MKSLILFISTLFFAFAVETNLTYDIKFGGLFGGKGKAYATIIKNDNNYSIKLEAHTKGYLKAFTSNRVEIYESYGKIKNNIFIPDKYIKKRINNYKTKIDTYIFNHNDKKIIIKKERFKENKKESWWDKSKFYAKNDILTLLFNLKYILNSKDRYKFYAIGANKTNGELSLELKDKKNKLILSVILDKEKLKDSKLFITINNDFLPSYIKLENVNLFGDVKAILKGK